jgi:archaemetzincin
MTGKIMKFTTAGIIVVVIVIATLKTLGQSSTSPNTREQLEKRSEQIRLESLGEACDCLKPLHEKRGPILPGDWLASHKERGQTFGEYSKMKPNGPDKEKKTIYIQLIGTFTKKQMEVLDQTMEYMQVSFGLPVKKLKAFPLKNIPATARRVHPTWKIKQLYTGYIMDKVLLPNRPKDAVALVGFTGMDLYPDPDWNFVFGIASLRQRIGLWSIYRNGDPAANPEMFAKCLRRTIATAIHETGHILSIKHCVGYECVMGGCNNRAESDRRGIFYCPSCLRKLTWNTKNSPAVRYKKLIALTKKLKLEKEHAFFEKSLKLLQDKGLDK